MIPAGRMTATAHADIGVRFRARPKAWVWGYVQTCVMTFVGFGDDLD
jgi:hypothetical protein